MRRSKMLSKELLNNKYSKFLPTTDKEPEFIKGLEQIKKSINLQNLNQCIKPLLVYSNVNQNPLFYLLAVNYSLQQDRVLDYVSVRAQTFVRQHFADKERDTELYDSIYYTDLLFITLTQADYTSEYMESLIHDLVEFRHNRNTYTVVCYEVIDKTDKTYLGQTKNLRQIFGNRGYGIIDLIQDITTQHSVVKGNKVVGKGRII